ncbi:MAG: outer membrane beta-barrel protein, partial [Rickettsiales bacterium]|nr:outer membrane beta-barrel protein [Rickettsiales bacterium]
RDFDGESTYKAGGFVEVSPRFNSWSKEEVEPYFDPEDAPGPPQDEEEKASPEDEPEPENAGGKIDARGLRPNTVLVDVRPSLFAYDDGEAKPYFTIEELDRAKAQPALDYDDRDPQETKDRIIRVAGDPGPTDAELASMAKKREALLKAEEAGVLRRIEIDGEPEKKLPLTVLRPENEYYGGLRIGYSFMGGWLDLTEQTGYNYPQENANDWIISLSAFLGTKLNAILNGLRIEAEYTYNRPVELAYNAGIDRRLLKIRNDTYVASAYLDYAFNQRFRGYVGGGFGAAKIHINDMEFNAYMEKYTTAWQISAGARARMTGYLALDAGVRYTGYGKIKRAYAQDYELGYEYMPFSLALYTGLVFGF